MNQPHNSALGLSFVSYGSLAGAGVAGTVCVALVFWFMMSVSARPLPESKPAVTRGTDAVKDWLSGDPADLGASVEAGANR